MLKTSIFINVIVLSCLWAGIVPLHADEVKLENDKVFEGKIVYEGKDRLILENPDFGFLGVRRSEISAITRNDFPTPGKEKGVVVVKLHAGKKYTGIVIKTTEESISIKISDIGPRAFKRTAIKQILPERDYLLPELNAATHGKFALLVIKLDSSSISLTDFNKQLIELGSAVTPSLLRYLSMKPKTSLINLAVEQILKNKNNSTVDYLVYLLKSTKTEVQLAIVKALGRIGDVDAVKALLPLMLGDNMQIGSIAEQAVRSILQKNPEDQDIINALHNAARSAKPIGKIRIINCLGCSRSRIAVDMLLSFLSDWEENAVKRTALTALGNLGFNDSNTCEKIRKFLKHKDDQVRKEAALALGRLQDFDSGKELIELLKDKNRGVRKNTYWALRNITGLKFPLHYDRWKIWWDAELKELKLKRKKYLNQLHSGERKKLQKAITELSKIKLGRKEIAESFLEYTDYGDVDIRLEICKALGEMKALAAVPHLVKCLEDYNQKVVAAAHKALCVITGKNIPPEKEKWAKWYKAQHK